MPAAARASSAGVFRCSFPAQASIPACCWSIIGGPYPNTALDVPILHVPFETAGAAIDPQGVEALLGLALHLSH